MRLAIESNASLDTIDKLLKESEGIETVDEFGHTLLRSAVAFSPDPRVVTLLLNSGADIDARDIQGRTALHIAVEEYLSELLMIVKNSFNEDFIFNATCDLDEEFKLGEKVDILVSRGADISQRDNNGRTPADLIVEHTVQCGKAIGDELGRTLNMLRHGMLFTQGFWFSNPSLESVIAEIGASVSPKITDYYGRTPLHYAVQHFHNDEPIRYLLDNGTDIMARDNHGSTPLHSAMYRFDSQLSCIPDRDLWHAKQGAVELLLKNGASVCAKDNLGRTPLHLAVICGSGNLGRILRVLEHYGADLAAQDKDGETPLHLGVLLNLSNIFLGTLTNPMVINSTDQRGQTPLHWAARCAMGRHNEIKDLDPEWVKKWCIGLTSIEFLLDNGAHIEARDNEGCTPLHLTVMEKPLINQLGNIKSLLAYGADNAAINNDGKTAYEVATSRSE